MTFSNQKYSMYDIIFNNNVDDTDDLDEVVKNKKKIHLWSNYFCKRWCCFCYWIDNVQVGEMVEFVSKGLTVWL